MNRTADTPLPYTPRRAVLGWWRRSTFGSFSLGAAFVALTIPAAQIPASDPEDAALPTVDVRVRAAATSAKVLRYAQRVVATHDANQDGRLQHSEWSTLQGEPAVIDVDGDAEITVDEFALHVARFATPRRIRLLFPESPSTEDAPLLQPKSAPAESAAKTAAALPLPAAAGNRAEAADATSADASGAADPTAAPAPATPRRRDLKFFVPASRLPPNLPSWFHARDKDGDGQISMAEYAESMTPAALAEFNRLDRNGDGVITAAECVPRSGNGGEPAKKNR